MRVIPTVMCVFAAFIMMAPTVMACCVTGHVDISAPSVPTVHAEAPSCHTTVEINTGQSDTQIPEKYCSSCDDCAVSSAFEVETHPFVKTQSDPNIVTILNASSALARPELRLLRSTGPPLREPLWSNCSPLSRFDSQLI